jgi:uncharacterized membrane protein
MKKMLLVLMVLVLVMKYFVLLYQNAQKKHHIDAKIINVQVNIVNVVKVLLVDTLNLYVLITFAEKPVMLNF